MTNLGNSLMGEWLVCTYQCQAGVEGGAGHTEGGHLIDCFGPGVEHLNYLAVPGGSDI